MKIAPGFYHSPRWSCEVLDCAMPMTFDTYSNCAHQCVYCFAFFQRSISGAADDYLKHRVKSVNVERVKRLFTTPDDPGWKYGKQFAEYIKRRMVLQWGGMSDAFDWYEKSLGKSLELLTFFNSMKYPVSISTKAVWFLDDERYVKQIRGADWQHWKESIITLNPKHWKKLEAGTPSPQDRFEALRRLKELGVGCTTFRFRPFIIGSSDAGAEEMLVMARDAGCYSVSTEFLCLEARATETHMERYSRISEMVGFDIFEFYKKHSHPPSGYLRLNYDIKRPYIEKLERLCKKLGLLFFVSDAHHKEKSAAGGCCGLPAGGPLSNWSKGQYSEAIAIARKKGRVHWSDIADDAAWLKKIPFKEAEMFNQGNTQRRAKFGTKSLFDYMHNQWNDIKSQVSPARYFGGALVPGGLDSDGNVIYLYNRPFVNDGHRVQSVGELIQLEAGEG